MIKALVISNMAEGDITFESNETGVWNVTRAFADCKGGLHGRYQHDVAELLSHCEAIEVEPDKVERYAADTNLRGFELIFVVDAGALWLIDGIHHLRAMHQRGLKHCKGYVIEEKDTARYRITFNGERFPPWSKRENND
jgi:hypothetical protein